MSPRRAVGVNGDVLEATFQRHVVRAFIAYGWRVHHPGHGGDVGKRGAARRGAVRLGQVGKGYPDLTAVHDGRRELLFAELKTRTGRLGEGQPEWIAALEAVSTAVDEAVTHAQGEGFLLDGDAPAVHVEVWRPADWPEALALIRGTGPRYPELEAFGDLADDLDW